MSIEGTLAGLLASFFLASVGCFLGQVKEYLICYLLPKFPFAHLLYVDYYTI